MTTIGMIQTALIRLKLYNIIINGINTTDDKNVKNAFLLDFPDFEGIR